MNNKIFFIVSFALSVIVLFFIIILTPPAKIFGEDITWDGRQKMHDAASIIDYIDGRFFVDSYNHAVFGKAFYSMAATKGKYGAGGWNEQFVSVEYSDIVNQRLIPKGCNEIENVLMILNATEIVAFDSDCKVLKDCNFKEKRAIRSVCLYERNK